MYYKIKGFWKGFGFYVVFALLMEMLERTIEGFSMSGNYWQVFYLSLFLIYNLKIVKVTNKNEKE